MERLSIATALAVLLLSPVAARAQQHPGHAPGEHFRHHLARIDTLEMRLDRVHHRFHAVADELDERLHGINRAREEPRFQRLSHLHDMSEAMGQIAEETLTGLERMRAMARNRDFRNDPEVQERMDALREHWEAIGSRLDESLGILEEIRRMQEPTDG